MLISRNEALERLHEIRAVHHSDPATAQALAISVLLDIVEDEHIRFTFKLATGFAEPLDHMMKLLAPDTPEKALAAEIVQSTSPFMEREQRQSLNAAMLRIRKVEHPND